MIINEFTIPAIAALKSTDADAIRQIVAVLSEEIVNLRKDVEELKSRKITPTTYVKNYKR